MPHHDPEKYLCDIINSCEVSQQTAEKISEYRNIIGFRHVLVHGYDSLDAGTVWSVVAKKLDILLQQAKNLIGSDKA
jgi:uncharacterized protein with HEPN domain